MTFLIHEITFYAVDDDGNELTNSKGETRIFAPTGRWKELEYLCEDLTEDRFEEIT